jgi:hypothetical protein
MDPVGTLVGLAEVSLALAGFAAIVLVLGIRADALEPHHAANVRVMVLNGVASAFFCLFAVAILVLDVPKPFVWRLLSALGLFLLIAASVMNYALFLRHLPPQPLLATIWWSLAAVAGAIQFVNVFGVFSPPSFGLMFLGLVVVLSRLWCLFAAVFRPDVSRPCRGPQPSRRAVRPNGLRPSRSVCRLTRRCS